MHTFIKTTQQQQVYEFLTLARISTPILIHQSSGEFSNTQVLTLAN